MCTPDLNDGVVFSGINFTGILIYRNSYAYFDDCDVRVVACGWRNSTDHAVDHGSHLLYAAKHKPCGAVYERARLTYKRESFCFGVGIFVLSIPDVLC